MTRAAPQARKQQTHAHGPLSPGQQQGGACCLLLIHLQEKGMLHLHPV